PLVFARRTCNITACSKRYSSLAKENLSCCAPSKVTEVFFVKNTHATITTPATTWQCSHYLHELTLLTTFSPILRGFPPTVGFRSMVAGLLDTFLWFELPEALHFAPQQTESRR